MLLPLQGVLLLSIRTPRANALGYVLIGLSARFVLLLPNPPLIESSSYIKINMTTYLLYQFSAPFHLLTNSVTFFTYSALWSR